MFPFLFLGGFLGSWFQGLFENPEQNNNNNGGIMAKWIDFRPDVGLLDYINIYEQGTLNNYTEFAHIPRGDKRITFGIGTVSIYNAQNKFYRSVRSGDTVTKVKLEMGYTQVSNLDFCKQLVLNYLGNSDKYKKIAAILDSTGVVFDESVARALYDFTFNSGGAFSKTKNHQFAADLKMAGSDKRKKAGVYFRFRFNYVANSVGRGTKQYLDNRKGWARRYYHNAKKIEGVTLDYNKLSTAAAVNGAFSDYQFVV